MKPISTLQSNKKSKSLATASFGLSLTAAWAAIAILWIITPLSYLYILYNLLTLIPKLSSAAPISNSTSTILKVLHYIALTYCSLEIPFSIYYRYLAIKANARRPNVQFSRKFLRNVFKKSLENGLNVEEDDNLMEVLTSIPLPNGSVPNSPSKANSESHPSNNARSTRSNRSSYELRNRKPSSDETNSSSIPQATTTSSNHSISSPPLSPKATSNHMNGNGNSNSNKKPYAPSFITTPLAPSDPRAEDFRNYIRGWFNNCEYSEIKKLNMAEWLSWSLYGQTYEELLLERSGPEEDDKVESLGGVGGIGKWINHDGVEVEDLDDEGLEIQGDKLGLVEHCVEMVEARAGILFEEGRNDTIKVIRLTLDPVKVISRPLILYLFVWCLQKTIIGNSKIHGFKEYRDGDTRYLLRMPPSWQPIPSNSCPESKRPFLFLHGLGMGLAQYATLLNYLSLDEGLKDRPICVLLQPSISMSFFSRGYLKPPGEEEGREGLKRIIQKWRFDESGVTVLSHSNGTIVHGWLVKGYPELVTRSCFVDPVCFCLWEPYVCFNFLYSKARTPIEYLMRFFVSRELGVALMLQRSFSWSSNLLFPTSIPNLHSPYHSAFYLAGKDAILNASRIRTYLKSHGVKEAEKGFNVGLGEKRGGLKVHAAKAHGQTMIGAGRAFAQIMDWVKGDLVGVGGGVEGIAGDDEGVSVGDSDA